MHSSHQNRGRVLFESLCALTIAGSFVAASIQTYANAFLPAAVAAGLYGLWHLTDMRGPRPVVKAAPAVQEAVAVAVEPVAGEVTAEPAKPKKRSRKKAPAAEPAAIPAADWAEIEAAVEAARPSAAEEEHSAPVVPLFEAQPLVRQQRTVFGRKAG